MTLPLCLLLWSALTAADPIHVGDRKQLFIDDRFLAERDRIELRANSAQKLGPLRDEEGKPLQGHISRVFEDGGKIRLYLGADDVELLESEDGLHFRRTGVELPDGGFPTLFLDEHESDPTKRYKLFRLRLGQPFDPAQHGVFAAYSADGVHFTEAGQVLPFFTDNPLLVFWDARISKYVIYTRALAYHDSDNQRRVARIETDDPLKPWPHTKTGHDRMFFSTENVPVVLAADEADDPHSDIYYNAAAIYPWAQDVYLMFPAHFR
ncbi:MAG: hypothetical protein KIT22_18275, partial [Verrucomicrobiae bacterium]|nr:hypothetical protein [Verrucomicrobiae bacterium]